jgi:23S rRNA (adenine2503-C2)-methyltransferase
MPPSSTTPSSEEPEAPDPRPDEVSGRGAVRGLLALTPAETEVAVVALGGRNFHARSLRRHVLAEGRLDLAAMTDLPAALRERLAHELPVLQGSETARRTARDGTIKLLTAFPGHRGGGVETVFIPSRKKERGATLCVSTQLGCPVRCPFCASGKLGLERGLSGAEILEQYVRGRALGPLARSVVMGIGEPLLNLPALEFALEAVRSEMGMGARRITVSTIGFPDRLRKLALRRPAFQLAISLHSPDDEQRSELVPLMAGVPVEEVLAAGDHWFEQTGREVTYEYVLLGGENDSPGHARRLAERLAGRRATVNLIPYNPIPGERFRRPGAEHVAGFQQLLTDAGVVATVRWSRGLEADAACGQLRQSAATKTSP